MAGNRAKHKRLHVLRCLLCAFTLLVIGHASAQEFSNKRQADSIVLKTESKTLYLGDVLVIDIESIGLLDALDISPLLNQSDFIRETTGTLISVVNGKVVEIAVRRIELTPRKEGLLVLGPLTGDANQGKVTSNSLAVNVEPAPTADWVPEPEDLAIKVTVSKASPYVSEQFELNIQLMHQYALAAEQITLPDFSGFDVTPIFESRRLIDNETDQRTTSWRYLLHAQRSGKQVLAGPSWSATLIRSRTQRYDFSLQHKPIVLDVASIPENFPENTWWLAAEALTLTDRWSSNVIQLSAGDEITRTIELNATGVLANHLPVVKPLATRSFHSTPLPVQRNHTLTGDITKASGLYEFRMIAESPVSVFLDTVRVPWFNTRTRKIEEAIIPARRVDILLPERADQLAELAIRRHSLNRFTLWLRSFTVTQWLIVTGVLAFCIVGLGIVQRQRFTAIRRAFKRFKQRSQWRYWAATNQWHNLYDALVRKTCPFDNLVAKTALQSQLGQCLFSMDDNPSNKAIRQAIKPHWQELVASPYPVKYLADSTYGKNHAPMGAQRDIPNSPKLPAL